MRESPPVAAAPKEDAERALAALERWAADRTRPVILLAGAAQSGKTVLLDVLASRLGRHFSVVYLAHSGSDPDELSARILTELGDPADGTPRLVLAREIERRAARPLVLLLDAADALPPRVELWLFDLARRSAGALRVVLALSDPRLAREFAIAFQADTEVVSIGETMSRTEAGSHLRRVEERSSEAAPLSFRRRARGAAGTRTEHEAPTPLRSAAPTAEPPAAIPSLAPVAGPRATTSFEGRLADAQPSQGAPSRVRVPAPPLAPRTDAPSVAAPRSLPLRWIVVSAALGLSFVAGFVLSELRDAQLRVRSETAATSRLTELPSVSSPPPAVSNEPGSGALAAPGEAGAGAPVVARPDPFARPSSPEAALPQERRDPAPALADAPGGNPLGAADPQAGFEGPPEEAAVLDRAPVAAAGDPVAEAPRRDGSTAALAATAPFATATPSAPNDVDAAELRPTVDVTAEAFGPDAPAVRAQQPRRRRSVAVRVDAEPGTEIRLGDRPLEVAPFGTVNLPPGAHRLLVRLPDGREVERVVEVRGTRYEIQVR